MPFDMMPEAKRPEIVAVPEVSDDDAIRVIKRAREIIRYPWHWTAWANARDWKGVRVAVTCDAAHSFCGRGALERAAYELALPVAAVDRADALVTGQSCSFTTGIPNINDRLLGYFYVHRAFSRAVTAHGK